MIDGENPLNSVPLVSQISSHGAGIACIDFGLGLGQITGLKTAKKPVPARSQLVLRRKINCLALKK
jgi:hypothetical protein